MGHIFIVSGIYFVVIQYLFQDLLGDPSLRFGMTGSFYFRGEGSRGVSFEYFHTMKTLIQNAPASLPRTCPDETMSIPNAVRDLQICITIYDIDVYNG